MVPRWFLDGPSMVPRQRVATGSQSIARSASSRREQALSGLAIERSRGPREGSRPLRKVTHRTPRRPQHPPVRPPIFRRIGHQEVGDLSADRRPASRHPAGGLQTLQASSGHRSPGGGCTPREATTAHRSATPCHPGVPTSVSPSMASPVALVSPPRWTSRSPASSTSFGPRPVALVSPPRWTSRSPASSTSFGPQPVARRISEGGADPWALVGPHAGPPVRPRRGRSPTPSEELHAGPSIGPRRGHPPPPQVGRCA